MFSLYTKHDEGLEAKTFYIDCVQYKFLIWNQKLSVNFEQACNAVWKSTIVSVPVP